MTTTTNLDTPCPDYCKIPAHDFNLDGGRVSRNHIGPVFGPYIAAWAQEFADELGVMHVKIDLWVPDVVDATVVDLETLSRGAQAAATWLAARQAEVQA